MRNPHGSFIWYEYMAKDVDAARAFYGAVAGLTVSEEGMGDIDYRMIGAPDGFMGGLLPLTDAMCEGGARPTWLGYIGVDDVDASVASITAAGGSVMMPANDVPTVGRIAMVTDPEGAPFYVMRGEPDERSNANSMNPGHIGWNELHAKDGKAALDFYAGQFGWAPSTEMDMGPMGKYRIFAIEGADAGATFNSPAAAAHPFWLFYIGVPDIDEAVAKVVPNGGSIMIGPDEVPGGVWVIQGTDPQGAMFALVGPRNQKEA